MSANGYNVYVGKQGGVVVYVGTTIQKATDRWRWHRSNGKDLDFELVKSCSDSEEMLELEFTLIREHKPKLNKITSRKQNLNRKLSDYEIRRRKDNKQWCQKCLKRRVNQGYESCYYCS